MPQLAPSVPPAPGDIRETRVSSRAHRNLASTQGSSSADTTISPDQTCVIMGSTWRRLPGTWLTVGAAAEVATNGHASGVRLSWNVATFPPRPGPEPQEARMSAQVRGNRYGSAIPTNPEPLKNPAAGEGSLRVGCARCGGPLPRTRAGRPRLDSYYCTAGCRRDAARDRRAAARADLKAALLDAEAALHRAAAAARVLGILPDRPRGRRPV